jgi:hypothetical protein
VGLLAAVAQASEKGAHPALRVGHAPAQRLDPRTDLSGALGAVRVEFFREPLGLFLCQTGVGAADFPDAEGLQPAGVVAAEPVIDGVLDVSRIAAVSQLVLPSALSRTQWRRSRRWTFFSARKRATRAARCGSVRVTRRLMAPILLAQGGTVQP